MPRKPKEPQMRHVLGTPLDVPPPEREILLRLGLIYEESSGQATRPSRPRATASKRSKSPDGSSKPGTK